MRAAIFQCLARDEPPPARLARLGEAVRAAAADGAELVVAPELFLSGYGDVERMRRLAEPMDGPFAAGLAEIAGACGVAVVAGYPERDGARLFNAALCVGADGGLLANYRKRLIPPGLERGLFDPGTEPVRIRIGTWTVAVMVCYDVEFPEQVREARRAGADVVAVPTALSAEWEVVGRKMIPTRALESGVFVLYANHAGSEHGYTYLGESRIVGPDGRDLACAGSGEEVITADLDKAALTAARDRLPYLEDLERG